MASSSAEAVARKPGTVAIAHAKEAAAAAGVALRTYRTAVTPDTLPDAPFDVVLVHHFLDREVWRVLPQLLAPGGVMLVCQPTVRNLERNPRPSARFTLEEGEAAQLAATYVADDPGHGGRRRRKWLEVIELTEGWTDDDRHEAHLVLRRKP